MKRKSVNDQSFSKLTIFLIYDSVSDYPINVLCLFVYFWNKKYWFRVLDRFNNYQSYFQYFFFYLISFSVCVHQPELL